MISFLKWLDMASHHRRLLLLLICTTTTILSSYGQTVSINSVSVISPITCSQPSPEPTCNAYLYAVGANNLSRSTVAALYSADASTIHPIDRLAGNKPADFLVRVPCRCQDAGDTTAYFHSTQYRVRPGDSPYNLTRLVFSGLAWNPGSDRPGLQIGEVITILLPCGCGDDDGDVVSYAVEQSDTLSSIAGLLDSDVGSIKKMNEELTANPDFLNPGWVLFVPMGKSISTTYQRQAKTNRLNMELSISMLITFLVIGGLLLFFRWRHKTSQPNIEDPPKKIEKSVNQKIMITSHPIKYPPHKKIKDVDQFESERPLVFSLREVDAATSKFDETRKIGEGGYGKVYHGMLGNLEVAIKKMKSSMSKEFYAELKVLCKVHHINVVELIGYASGDGHLYLIYEYVHNSSLNEHLHDPLLKGHHPLSWYARAQIALDSARGIEYIHDHTKARYVHRDIKTSNILLDGGLRAKVADFGLAKLVERSDDDDFMATRLVGTPGYLPPEAVREFLMTTKTDVYAFGVVLAELITGCRALFRENSEPNRLRSIASLLNGVFHAEDTVRALEAVIDRNLNNRYPLEEVFKMAEISVWCMNKEALGRPEMSEITTKLSQILISSTEWEASLGGPVFSGIFNGR